MMVLLEHVCTAEVDSVLAPKPRVKLNCLCFGFWPAVLHHTHTLFGGENM